MLRGEHFRINTTTTVEFPIRRSEKLYVFCDFSRDVINGTYCNSDERPNLVCTRTYGSESSIFIKKWLAINHSSTEGG